MAISRVTQDMDNLEQKVKKNTELMVDHRSTIREFVMISKKLIESLDQRVTTMEQGGVEAVKADANALGADAQVLSQTLRLVSDGARELTSRMEEVARRMT